MSQYQNQDGGSFTDNTGNFTGTPLNTGYTVLQTNPTAQADLTPMSGRSDKLGRAIVTVGHARELVYQNTVKLNNTIETSILTPLGAGNFLDLTLLEISNTSSTAVVVDIRDSTAGTVRKSYGLAANSTIIISMPIPWKQTTDNANWTAQLGTAVTDVRINVQAVNNV